MQLRNSLLVFALLSVEFAAIALAGEAVEGVAAKRADAMKNADDAAKEQSQKRFGRKDCYTAATVKSCRKDKAEDEWICVAYVANHQGSCPKQ